MWKPRATLAKYSVFPEASAPVARAHALRLRHAASLPSLAGAAHASIRSRAAARVDGNGRW